MKTRIDGIKGVAFKSVKVTIERGLYDRHIEITEDGITVTIMNDGSQAEKQHFTHEQFNQFLSLPYSPALDDPNRYVKQSGDCVLVAWRNTDEMLFESWVEKNGSVIDDSTTTPCHPTVDDAWEAAQSWLNENTPKG